MLGMVFNYSEQAYQYVKLHARHANRKKQLIRWWHSQTREKSSFWGTKSIPPLNGNMLSWPNWRILLLKNSSKIWDSQPDKRIWATVSATPWLMIVRIYLIYRLVPSPRRMQHWPKLLLHHHRLWNSQKHWLRAALVHLKAYHFL